MRFATRKAVVVTISAAVVSFAAQAEAWYAVERDVIYGKKAGMALTMDVVRPGDGIESNGVGLLCMMSRGWNSTWTPTEKMMGASRQSKGRFASVVSQGFTLFLVWHGSEPYFKVPDAVSDVRRAVRYIRHHADDLGVDPEKLGVFGASAGGHLAFMLGTTADDGDADAEDPVERESSRVAAVVAYFAPGDLRPVVGRENVSPALSFDPDLADDVSPILHVDAGDAPALMVHGDQDKSVPISQSEDMLAAFEKAGVETELIVIEGAGHAFRGSDAGRAASAQMAWFKKHLLE